jgi:hypothetical protein
VPRRSRPSRIVAYATALAITVVTTLFFGWAGFWLGLAVFAFVKLGLWAAPLIRLSYAADHHEAEPR